MSEKRGLARLFRGSLRKNRACPRFSLGEAKSDDAKHLETCQRKRNAVEYDRIGAVTDSDVTELIQFAEQLREHAMRWLRENHPEVV